MRPLFIGHSEKTTLEELTEWGGYDLEGERIELDSKDLETHLHLIGASRTGKSKMAEWIARELIRRGKGMCVVDPHGFLYDDLLNWLAYLQPDKEIILFDPSFENRVVGFNPFVSLGGDVSIQADRMVQATIKAWGETNTNQTPRLERWLRSLYHVILERNYSLEYVRYLLSFKEKEARQYLVSKIDSDLIKNEFEELSNLTRLKDFLEQIESTRNRLFRFMDSRQVRRIVGLNRNNINLEDIIENEKILLVNLQPKRGILSNEGAKLLGTLLLSELWDVAKHRKRDEYGDKPNDFFVLIDEFQLFLTPDIPEMLDQAAKYGIHLILCHQHLSQLEEMDKRIYGAVMGNAKTKIVFGGLSDKDGMTMARELFPGQINLKRIKFLIEQTKFWPKVGRAITRNKGRGGGTSEGTSSGDGGGVDTSSSSGMSWDSDLNITYNQSDSRSTNDSWSESSFRSRSENWSEGESDVPFIYPQAFKELSTITPYSLEEQLWQIAGVMRNQYQRHFIIQRPGRPSVAGVTPFLKSFRVTQEDKEKYIENCLSKYLSPVEVDNNLLEIHKTLLLSAGCNKDDKQLTEFNPEDVWEKSFSIEEEM
ncbi:MAG: TraM recognition domain-containing protein [Ignavibacteria bacterium]|nr:TraM recognition domain-containing protein [Ignavibacteria bacterium]